MSSELPRPGARTPTVLTRARSGMGALALASAIGVAVAPEPAVAGQRYLLFLLGLVLCDAMARGCRSPQALPLAQRSYALLGAVVAVAGAAATAMPAKLLPQWTVDLLPSKFVTLPTAEGWINANALAGTLVCFLPLCVALSLRSSEGRRWRLALGAAAGTIAVVLVVLQSRGAAAGALAGVATMMAWMAGDGAGGRRLRRAVVVGVPALALLLSVSAAWIDQSRVQLWGAGLRAVALFPLTGVGFNAFRSLQPLLWPLPAIDGVVDIAHAHNVFLQVALDAGLGGLAGYLLTMTTLLRALWADRPRTGAGAAGIAGGVVGVHVFGMTDTLALGSVASLIFWSLVGLGLATVSGQPASAAAHGR